MSEDIACTLCINRGKCFSYRCDRFERDPEVSKDYELPEDER